MVDDQAAIAVLGPAQDAGAATLKSAQAVGGELGAAGYLVIVRGSGDVAEAAARGARSRGGAVLEVVPDAGANAGMREVADGVRRIDRVSTLQALEAVLDHADALIALPGDLEALAAVFQIWSYGGSRDAPYRPLVLLGEAWTAIVRALGDAAGLEQRERAMVTFATTEGEAVETLRYYVSPRP